MSDLKRYDIRLGTESAEREINLLQILKKNGRMSYNMLCYRLSKYAFTVKLMTDDLEIYGYIEIHGDIEKDGIAKADISITGSGLQVCERINEMNGQKEVNEPWKH